MSALPPKADMCSANRHVCFGPKADMTPKTERPPTRRSLRNSIWRFDQTAAFRFLRQPIRPNAPKPVANSGSAAGSGASDTAVMTRLVLPEIETPLETADRPAKFILLRMSKNEQQVTAGDALKEPKLVKMESDVRTPPETVKELFAGLPIYSPKPNPAALLVTWTLVAC